MIRNTWRQKRKQSGFMFPAAAFDGVAEFEMVHVDDGSTDKAHTELQ